MTKETILSKINLTLLREAGGDEITALCDNALDFGCASICVPPCYVKYAAEYVGNAIPISTIIGFPFGFETTESKCFQAENAISLGASEIDIMINLGRFKAKDYGYVVDEIRSVKKVCEGKILKVVVELPQLTLDNKIRACNLVAESGADYIKTSTGFSTGSSMLIRCFVLFSLKCLRAAYKVVVLPEPVGPERSMMPLGSLNASRNSILCCSLIPRESTRSSSSP